MNFHVLGAEDIFCMHEAVINLGELQAWLRGRA